MLLADKVALVTGSGSGIGRAIAVRYSQEGCAAVIVVDKNIEAGQETVATIQGGGGHACFIQGDVTSPIAIENFVAETVLKYQRLDILVNNAAWSAGGTVAEMSLDDWNKSIATCLTSVFLCTKHAIHIMRRQGNGVILNISSTNSIVSNPGFAAYAAAKAGVNALTRVVAIDHGREGIRANAICPGYIALPEAEGARNAVDHAALEDASILGRAGTVDDIASAAAFLVSEEAKWITGTCLIVDGGLIVQSPAAVLVPHRRTAAGRSSHLTSVFEGE